MELSKEHLIAFDEILKKYQTEYGEQEYKMYYDVDLPKIMMERRSSENWMLTIIN